jgi:hypothetical protein
MESEGMPRRTFLKLGLGVGAASIMPGIANSADRKPEKKQSGEERPTVQYLALILDTLKGKLQLTEAELKELGDLNQKYESWHNRNSPQDDGSFTQADQEAYFHLCGKFINYKQALEVLADSYTKASDYKGKNVPQEELDTLRTKARELGYEHPFFDQP